MWLPGGSILKPESIEVLEQHLKLQSNLFGPGSVQVSRVLFRLANSYLAAGKKEMAISTLERALANEANAKRHEPVYEDIRGQLHELLGTESGDYVTALRVSSDHIPAFSPHLDQLTELPEDPADDPLMKAIVTARLEIEKLKKNDGPQTLVVAEALTRLADLYCRKNSLAEMETTLIEALRIRETINGSAHISVATDLKNLGRLYLATGKYETAEPLFKRALEIREAAYGPNHSYVADVAELYAKLLRKTERQEEADRLEELIRQVRENFGSDWEHYQRSARKAVDSKNYFLAQALWLAALEEAAEFEFDDPRLMATLESLAEVYWRRRKFERAEPLCKRLLEIAKTLHGNDHRDVALAANNLALVCDRQGKYVEAAMLFQETLIISEALLGADHPDIEVIKENHTRARQMAQKQIERKVENAQRKWSTSGWWRAYQKELKSEA